MSHSTDIAIRRQVMLERIKAGYAREYAKTVDEIVREVSAMLHRVDDERLSDMPAREFNAMLKEAIAVTGGLMQVRNDQFADEMDELAESESNSEVATLAALLALSRSKIKVATDAASYARNRRMEATGTFPRTVASDMKRSEMKQMERILGQSRVDKITVSEAIRRLRGTRRARFEDSLYSTQAKRRTKAMSGTIAQHSSSASREITWLANKGVVGRYIWISILDGSTTPICQSRSQRIFEIGKGPLEPAHIACRSRTSILIDGEPEPSDESYYSWIQRQPVGFQEQAMGKKWSKLLRDGGLSADQFAKLRLDRRFEPITLKEAEIINPQLFVKADVDA